MKNKLLLRGAIALVLALATLGLAAGLFAQAWAKIKGLERSDSAVLGSVMLGLTAGVLSFKAWLRSRRRA